MELSNSQIFRPAADESSRNKRARKAAVHFSPNVTLRIVSDSSNHFKSPWHSAEDVKSMKLRAKTLAKLHYRLSAAAAESETLSSAPSTYELKGESLRGMEHLTDISMGRRRQCLKSKAIATTIEEQEIQLEIYSSRTLNANGRRRIAQEYANVAREAVEYSKRIAEEDAREAAAILREDLFPSRPAWPCPSSNANFQSGFFNIQRHQREALLSSIHGMRSSANGLNNGKVVMPPNLQILAVALEATIQAARAC
mmetsp:Transcript_10838/g.22929  ORF Transcript_10838/g.22929 Transcript_10838/m.22929 type:complete len:254 (-) Transcript_10838:192-953(-)